MLAMDVLPRLGHQDVLYPFSLRDTLLRLAERELYVLTWSERANARVTPAATAHRP
jgi:hypothetical protein